ncbi:hypothetical protein CC80DRAFT_565767, partial [Byssothecium circinans]
PMLDEPFPLMKLPASVRKRIYRYLLVIPAIICVRQKHSSFHDKKKAFLYEETRTFLPGIAYARPQFAVDGPKFRYTLFKSANTFVLRACREVYNEAKPVLYGQNLFEIVVPSSEMNPPVNFKIRLFPLGCQRLVRHLFIRVRALYPAQWLVNGGYKELKKAYRGLETLTLILEMETAGKGLVKRLMKRDDETWVPYVKRAHETMAAEITGPNNRSTDSATKIVVPVWIDLRVLFDGDRYDEMLDPVDQVLTHAGGNADENTSRMVLKRGLAEAFELFKKGGR